MNIQSDDAWSTSAWHVCKSCMIAWSTSELWTCCRWSSWSAPTWNLGWCHPSDQPPMDDINRKGLSICWWIHFVLRIGTWWWNSFFFISGIDGLWPRDGSYQQRQPGRSVIMLSIDWSPGLGRVIASGMPRWSCVGCQWCVMGWSHALISWQICIKTYGSHEINCDHVQCDMR